MHPAALLEGDELQRREPRRWVRDPRQELAFVRAVLVVTLVLVGGFGLLGVVFPPTTLAIRLLLGLPAAAMLLAGLALVLRPAVELVRGWLAARRLGLQLRGVPAALAAGQGVDVELILRPRCPVEVGRLHVLFAGTAEFRVVRGTGRNRSSTGWVELLHRAVTNLELNERLEPGDERRFRARFEVPGRAAPTRERRRGRSVRWIVAAVAEVPRWPDPAVVHEVEVWRAHTARRSG